MSAAWKKFKFFAKAGIRSELFYECIKIVLIYFVVGSLWIFLSDELTSLFVHDEKSRLMLSAGKGWFYVIITSLLLYALIMRLIRKVDEAERAKAKSYRELEAVLRQQLVLDEELRLQVARVTESEKSLEFLSYHDQLTGLYNRRYFEEMLPYYDTKAHLPLTVIMADVNGLKMVNDSFGHAVGDRILKEAADIFRQLC